MPYIRPYFQLNFETIGGNVKMKKRIYLVPFTIMVFSFILELIQDSFSFLNEIVVTIIFFVGLGSLALLLLLELTEAVILFITKITTKEENKNDRKKKNNRTNAEKPANTRMPYYQEQERQIHNTQNSDN